MTIDTEAIRREAEEALEIARKASQGPWFPDPEHGSVYVRVNNDEDEWADYEEAIFEDSKMGHRPDCEFIADSRTRVPSQAEQLKECADEIDELRATFQRMENAWRDEVERLQRDKPRRSRYTMVHNDMLKSLQEYSAKVRGMQEENDRLRAELAEKDEVIHRYYEQQRRWTGF